MKISKRLFQNSQTKEYLVVLIKDFFWFLVSIIITVPCGIIEKVIERMRKYIQNKQLQSFVNWNLDNWREVYFNIEESSLVSLQVGINKKELIPQVLYFDNSIYKLSLDKVSLYMIENEFELKDEIRQLTNYPFKKFKKIVRYTIEENVRLVNSEMMNGELALTIQPVDYESYVHTNLLLDAKIPNSDITLRKHIHPEGKLEDLSSSPLGNNFGINILLFTSDGKIVLQERSQNVAFRRGELCPSASGTIARIDIPSKTVITLEQMHKLREAFEEIGIKSSHVDAEKTIFLGITRELARGGEPEIFFSAITSLSSNELQKKWEQARDNWEASRLVYYPFELASIGDKEQFFKDLTSFFNSVKGKIGVTLKANIALWVKYHLNTHLN